MPYTAREVNQGAGIILGAFGLNSAIQLGGLMYSLVTSTPPNTQLLVLLLSLWVYWAAYTGQLWARLGFTLFSVLGGGWLLLLGLSLPQYLLALAGLLLVVSGCLLWLPNVGAYFEYVSRQID